VTGLVDGLGGRGRVARLPAPNDRRARLVRLTKAGRALLDDVLPGNLKRLACVMAGWTKAEQQRLVRLLREVHAGCRSACLEHSDQAAQAVEVEGGRELDRSASAEVQNDTSS
jgi:hypothetical protein